MVDIEVPKQAEECPIDIETATRIVKLYIDSYGEQPTETHFKSSHRIFELRSEEDAMIVELGALLRVRPRFMGYFKADKWMSRVGLAPEQVAWLQKKMK